MSLVQDAKDREERISRKHHGGNKAGGTTIGSYFGQQNQGNPNRFGGNRGNYQNLGCYRKPYGGSGTTQQAPRTNGGGFNGRPNKHPDSEVALERWRSIKGVGEYVKPMMKDCPLKCSHPIPFANTGWCEKMSVKLATTPLTKRM